LTGLLTEDEVHGTTAVAAWLGNQLEWQKVAARIPPAPDMNAAHRLLLANYEICRVRYAQALETTRNPLSVYQSYVELRQAAWTIRLAAWIYRSYDGWQAEWFTYERETVSA
jgi:hypothetical protein